MNYRLTLQIIAAVITAAILVGFHYGYYSLVNAMSPDFTSGLLVGGLFVFACFAAAILIDRKSSSDPTRRR